MDAPERKFYPELESLRGLAALSVVMLHIIIFLMFKVPGGFDGAKYYLAEVGWPAYLIGAFGMGVFNGRAAVQLFFVLSGYLMSVNFDTRDQLSLTTYVAFLLRRFFRLVPAIWAAVAVAVALGYLADGKSFSPREIVRFALLLDLSFDGPLWSLIYEIAVCIFYPLMLVFTRRLNVVLQLLVLAGIYWMQVNRPVVVHYGAVAFAFPLFAFYLGLIIPTAGRALVESFPKGIGLGLLALSLAVIAGQAWFKALVEFDPPIVHAYFNSADEINSLWTNCWTLLAAFYIIAWIRFSKNGTAARILTTRPALFLGSTSYSIYVLHAPIMVAVLHLIDFSTMHPFIRLVVGTLAVVPATLLLASATYHWVERPAIRIGRALAMFIVGLCSPTSEYRPPRTPELSASPASASV
jgi:peptidoglycan/LPS O-acetylase OafA/YrhL